MISSLTVAVFAGLAGMLGWGLADFFAKKTIDRIGDLATLAWAHVFGVLLLAFAVLARLWDGKQLAQIPTDPREISLLAFFGVLQATVYFLVYRGFGKGKLALLNPVFSSYSGLVVLLSVLVFGEVISGSQFAVLFITFTGIMTINLDEESLALRKLRLGKISGMKEILGATLLAALWTVLWGHFVSGKDWLIYAAIMYWFMSVTILLMCLLQKISLNVTDRKIWKFFAFIGVAEVIAYVGVSIGFSLTSHTSIVAVLSSAFSVPTVILAHAFLKERITWHQIAGITAVITGVTLIALL